MRVLEVAFGYPTVVFTTLLLLSIGYWMLSFILGFDSGGGLEADFDLDSGSFDTGSAEAGSAEGGSGEGGSEPGAGSSRFSSIAQVFDVHSLPLGITLTAVSLAGFFVSALATLGLTSSGGSTSAPVGIAIVLLGLLSGTFFAARVAVLLGPIFMPTPTIKRSDLIGRICTIRTGSVSTTFGQAEATDSALGSHLIQVRCSQANSLVAGATALIISVSSDGEYTVSEEAEFLA